MKDFLKILRGFLTCYYFFTHTMPIVVIVMMVILAMRVYPLSLTPFLTGEGEVFFMAKVNCNNTRNEKNTIVKCDRYFVQLPQCIIDNLKSNPGEKIILRCPTCPSMFRWVAIYYSEKDGYVWETIKKPQRFDNEMKFDLIINSEQIG